MSGPSTHWHGDTLARGPVGDCCNRHPFGTDHGATCTLPATHYPHTGCVYISTDVPDGTHDDHPNGEDDR